MRPRKEHREAGLVPYADHVIQALVAGQRLGGTLETLVTQGQGDLLEVIVEQFPGLVAGRPVGRPAADQHRRAKGAQEREQEIAADRVHDPAGTM